MNGMIILSEKFIQSPLCDACIHVKYCKKTKESLAKKITGNEDFRGMIFVPHGCPMVKRRKSTVFVFR